MASVLAAPTVLRFRRPFGILANTLIDTHTHLGCLRSVSNHITNFSLVFKGAIDTSSVGNRSLWHFIFPLSSYLISLAPCFSEARQRQEFAHLQQKNTNALREKFYSGGGAKAMEHHTVKNGKLFVRDRIKKLLDPDSHFLEIGALAAHQVCAEAIQLSP